MLISRSTSVALLCAGLLCSPTLARAADSEVKALENAKFSLNDAISAAEKASGGKAMDAKIETEKNASVYDITVLKGDDTEHYVVDASSSTATAVKSKSMMDKIDHESKDEKAAVMSMKMSLSDAVSAVEKHTGGKAVEAEIEVKDHRTEYNVEVAKNGTTMKKTVDAMSGKVIADK